jgi:Pyridoxamine 5'-phosphate oxidase
MAPLPPRLRQLIESGPLVHLATINPDGTPQVTVIWVALDGDDLLSGHMSRYRKVRNIERDPRVVLSFDAPRDHEAYMSPDSEFPAPRGPGFTVRYEIEWVGGIGPWASSASDG